MHIKEKESTTMNRHFEMTQKQCWVSVCDQAVPVPRRWLHRARIPAAILAITLTGCVVGPDYKTPQTTLPQTYKTQPGPESLAAGPAPPLDSWWTGFHDPELVSIIKRILTQNLDLDAAMARVRQARAVAKGAGAQEMPQGNMDASVARQHQSLDSPLGKIARVFPGYERNQTLEAFDIGARWELDLAGGLKRNAEVARDEARAAEAMRTGVRIFVAAEAADAYFRVLGAKSRIVFVEQQVKTDAKLLDLEQKRIAFGVSTKRDLAQAEVKLAQARANLPALRIELELQVNRLDVLMGATPGTYDSELKAAQAGYAIPAINTGEGPQELLRRRPDVIAAERRLAASNARIGAALAEYYPKVSLSALLGFESLGTKSMFTPSSFQPAAIAGLRWRLFDFGLVDAEVVQAKGAMAEALADFRQTILRATEDVENAVTTFAQLNTQKNELQNMVNAHEQALGAVQREFEAGAVGLIDVLDEDHQLLAAREELARLNANEARAAVGIFRAVGGGWTPPEASRINTN
jgi:NodT family efflux transporter outer membrane factor (OMF) lipoprotein